MKQHNSRVVSSCFFYLFIYFIYLLTICNKTLKTYFSIVKIYTIGGLQEWFGDCVKSVALPTEPVSFPRSWHKLTFLS